MPDGQDHEALVLNRDCPKCEGTGRYRDSRIWGTMPGSATCDDCDGTGKVSRPAKPSVPPPVPPGIREAWGVGGAGPGRLATPPRDSDAAVAPVRMIEIECANEEGCEAIVGYMSSRWLPADDPNGLRFPEIMCPDCGEALMPEDDDD